MTPEPSTFSPIFLEKLSIPSFDGDLTDENKSERKDSRRKKSSSVMYLLGEDECLADTFLFIIGLVRSCLERPCMKVFFGPVIGFGFLVPLGSFLIGQLKYFLNDGSGCSILGNLKIWKKDLNFKRNPSLYAPIGFLALCFLNKVKSRNNRRGNPIRCLTGCWKLCKICIAIDYSLKSIVFS